jgi:Sulfotransferase family
LLAFAHLRKTAGSTTAWILRRNFGPRLFETRGFARRLDLTGHDLCQVRRLYRHLECIAGEQLSPAGELYDMYPQLRFFTFVREPISRCVSNFQWRLNCMVKYHHPALPTRWMPAKWQAPRDLKAFFREWLELFQRNLQTQRIAGCQDADRAIEILHQRVGFVGLVEEFDDSLVMWREWTGKSGLNIAYRARNVSARGKFPRPKVLRQMMDEDSAIARLVTEANREDQRLYDFVRQELFRAQRARFERALRTVDRETLVLRSGLDAGTIRTVNHWIYRTLVYKPLRPMLFRQAA